MTCAFHAPFGCRAALTIANESLATARTNIRLALLLGTYEVGREELEASLAEAQATRARVSDHLAQREHTEQPTLFGRGETV